MLVQISNNRLWLLSFDWELGLVILADMVLSRLCFRIRWCSELISYLVLWSTLMLNPGCHVDLDFNNSVDESLPPERVNVFTVLSLSFIGGSLMWIAFNDLDL